MNENISKLLASSVSLLRDNNIDNAHIDVKILLEIATGKKLHQILLNKKLTEEEQKKFFNYIELRKKHIPIAYITGIKEFFGLNFFVSPAVLIPRNDSELIIEIALKIYQNREKKYYILDLGTGSACLIITLLTLFKNSFGLAIDISQEALLVAQKNLIYHKLENRLKLKINNWLDNLPNQKFDLIISNPPYISINEKNLMAKETLEHEPQIALFANDNGIEAYNKIAIYSQKYLTKDGNLLLEIGYNQENIVKEIFIKNNFQFINCYRDIQNNPRVVHFKI